MEFGATNGVDLSNTYFLEKCFGWKGILAEPAKGWHKALKKNRDDYELYKLAKGKRYKVDTISLMDMLEKHQAPHDMDYLSIDTEGSEYDILKAFDFSRYSFKVITVEHNYTDERQRLYDLLTKAGYRRKQEKLSLFDDWYVRE